jgi:NAD(P)-dependent dehydrogenase (short-subunit alcohol dehydrogenase family)
MSKVWLINGASRGPGRNIAEAALAGGDHVVATARKPERFYELVERYGGRIRTGQQDVRDPSAAETAVQTAVDAFGRIDVVVDAARSAEPAVEDFEVDTFRVPVETNLFGFIT